MKLKEILTSIQPVKITGNQDIEITGVDIDSMKTYLQPSSAMRPNKRFNVIGSGVVCSVGMASSSI